MKMTINYSMINTIEDLGLFSYAFIKGKIRK